MPENGMPGPVCDLSSVRESVCIHTKKIFDSCRDKDCVESLRFYPTQAAQEVGIPVVPYPPVQAHHRRDAIPLRLVESHRGLRDEPAKKKNFAAALSLLAILCSMVL